MKLYLNCVLLAFLYHICVVSLQSNEVLNHLGTRTPYRCKSNKKNSLIHYPGCKEKKIWMIIRHGTRFPAANDIRAMNTTLKNMKYTILLQHQLGNGKLSKEQLESLEEWSADIDIDKEKFLTLEGQEEMILLAERMQKRFPDVIKTKYDNESFLFRYTATERAQQSARYFANGLFKQKEAEDVIFAPSTVVDPVLRFYKHCDKWLKQVKKNNASYKEYNSYSLSQEMNVTLESVTKRLGLTKALSFDDVKLMFKTCGYETAWYKHYPSPWCAPFDKESAQVMEYLFDLKHYWLDGYGHEITYRQACISVKNMFENFSSKGDPKAVFFFTHSGTILKIIAHLGLYKPDSHLVGDVRIKDRPWKTTDIDCFASNLAFVLYDCEDGDHVLTLHQEHVIKMPMCDTELCPLEVLTKHFHKSIHDCDFTDMCSLERNEL